MYGFYLSLYFNSKKSISAFFDYWFLYRIWLYTWCAQQVLKRVTKAIFDWSNFNFVKVQRSPFSSYLFGLKSSFLTYLSYLV